MRFGSRLSKSVVGGRKEDLDKWDATRLARLKRLELTTIYALNSTSLKLLSAMLGLSVKDLV